jgi:hypothetical protein
MQHFGIHAGYDLWVTVLLPLRDCLLQPTSIKRAAKVNQAVRVTLENGRAKRYAVTLPVRYRLVGSERCETGWTENMSVSGLLFTTASALDAGSQLEIWVQISSDASEGNRSMLYCRGPVVRQLEDDGRTTAAVRITRVRSLPAVPDFTKTEYVPSRGEQL